MNSALCPTPNTQHPRHQPLQVPWSRLVQLCERVKRRIGEEHAAALLPGRPLVSVRVTQLYREGACVYVYFAMGIRGMAAPIDSYAKIEKAARQEVLACGGSLSHHHGVGQVRAEFLKSPSLTSPALLESLREVKRSIDPGNVFGARNNVMAD